MPHSVADDLHDTAGRRLAVTAEALYLANLLLLPLLSFALLLFLYMRHSGDAPALALNHLRQAVAGSLWAGVLLALVSGLAILVGGLHEARTWMVVLTYLVTCHAALVLAGMIGLARAMAGRTYRYPIIGPAL